MRKYYKYTAYALVLLIMCQGCEGEDEFTPPNYVTFERENTSSVGVDIGGTVQHEVTVYTANITGNDRDFNLIVNEGTTLEAAGYDLPATVTIPGGTNEGSFVVEVSDMNLGLTGKNLIIDLEKGPDLLTGNSYTIAVNRTCVGREFTIDLEFDGYASEIEWSITDSEGNELVTGGNYADGSATATRSLCLDSGTYIFAISDSYGDGLTYPNIGSVTLSYAGEVLELIPGDFGEGTSVEVTL